MKQQINKTTNKQSAFVLPTVLVLSVVLLSLGLSVFQLTSSIARSLTDQYWQRLARQATQAGVSYMSACVDQGLSSSTWPVSITQDNTCLGVPLGTPQPSIYTNTGDANPVPNPFQARFTIYKPTTGADGIPKARVVGAVDILSSPNGIGVRTTIKTYTYEMMSIINGPMQTVSQVVRGRYNTCALADGQAYCWGLNDYGQLGTGNNNNSIIPVAVSTSGVLSGKFIIQMSGNYWHNCALASGQVYCWGSNVHGQLGNSNNTNSSSPVAVTTSGVLSGKFVTQVAVGAEHSCALANGQAFCWGYNPEGQLGNNSTTYTNVPVAVTTSGVLSGKVITKIAGGYYHTCVIASGQAFCWGFNGSGQLGNNSINNSSTPVAVDTSGILSGKSITDLAPGRNHTCSLAGQAYCWGLNDSGQLGTGNNSNSLLPVAVTTSGALSDKVITQLVGGYYHTCAIALSQSYCWGLNDNGQLGNNATANSNAPVETFDYFSN
ncbi:MAG: hypothetical protein AAB395_03545 [Patescibacteria group bacterium]